MGNNFALRFELYGTCLCEVPTTLMTITNEKSDVTTASHDLNTAQISELTSPLQSYTSNGAVPATATTSMNITSEKSDVTSASVDNNTLPISELTSSLQSDTLNVLTTATTLMTITREKSDVTSASADRNTVLISDITSPLQTDTSNASANDPNLSGKAGQSSSSTGTTIGIIIGVLLILGLLFVILLWLLKRRQARDGTNSDKRSDGENNQKRYDGNATEGHEHHNVVYQSAIDEQQPHTMEVKNRNGDIQSDPKESKEEGLIHIYACSQYGGRPRSAAKDQDDIYHDIKDDPGEESYAVVDSKDPSGSPVTDNGGDNVHDQGWEENRIYAQGSEEGGNDQEKVNEGWEDNGIYASGNDKEGQSPSKVGEKTEGWGDNNIYASTDENGMGQEEGWKDNTIYAGGDT